MKIFTGAQIHELDKYTIEHEPISSIDLMERAAGAITRSITGTWSSDVPVVVLPVRVITAAMRWLCLGCLPREVMR